MLRLFSLCLATAIGAVPLCGEESDLLTNIYVVPPTFRSVEIDQRPTAIEILSSAGIPFPEGGSAVYDPATSRLIVRNSAENMDLVEAYIDSIVNKVENQVYLIFHELEFDSKPDFFAEWGVPVAQEAANSQVSFRSFDDPDAFFRTLSETPGAEAEEISRAKRGIVGVFTEQQVQMVFRLAKDLFDLDDISPEASIMTRSGKPALARKDASRWGVIPVIGGDLYTIELDLYLPAPGEAFFPEGPGSRRPDSLTIWDGQTVAYSEEKEDGHYRIVFVTAQIVDPAGMPLARERELAEAESTIEELAKTPSSQPEPSSLAEKQALVKKADEAALRGSQLMADGNFGAAATLFTEALELLPVREITEPRRTAYQKQLEAAQAKRDPGEERFHIVRKGESLFDISRRYDRSVGRLKDANRLEGDSILVGQLLVVPGVENGDTASERKIREIIEQVVIPSYDVRDVSMREAVGLIQIALLANVDSGLFPNLAPKFVLEDLESLEDSKITLRLGNVPVAEALRYVAELGQCTYESDGEQIVIRSK